MRPEEWAMQALIGGLFGMLGQGVRVIAGLKKSSDSAAASGQDLADVFEGGTLLTSLLIGFVAGAIAMLAAGPAVPVAKMDHSLVMAIISSGYAGTDFIEAFIRRSVPAASSSADLSTPPMG
jgi:hypothetical protein